MPISHAKYRGLLTTGWRLGVNEDPAELTPDRGWRNMMRSLRESTLSRGEGGESTRCQDGPAR